MSRVTLVFSRCRREFGVTAGMVSAVVVPWSGPAWAPFVFVPCFFFFAFSRARLVTRCLQECSCSGAVACNSFSCPYFVFVGVACSTSVQFSV